MDMLCFLRDKARESCLCGPLPLFYFGGVIMSKYTKEDIIRLVKDGDVILFRFNV